jgi:sugar O-acyltransferase (sialic acid O-acetyltransferase NeuD family)
MSEIILYGASGHAKVIIDIIEQAGIHTIIGLVDDTGSATNLMGYQVVGEIGTFLEKGIRAGLVAVGDNWLRNKLATKILEKCDDFEFVTAIHPSVNTARDTIIGKGAVVMAGASINSGTRIGNHCIINTGSNIDHECCVHHFASLAPGVTLGGNVTVGEYTAIGLGASVIQKVTVGSHSVIGAGSVVLNDMGSNLTAYGNPCKFVRTREVGQRYL